MSLPLSFRIPKSTARVRELFLPTFSSPKRETVSAKRGSLKNHHTCPALIHTHSFVKLERFELIKWQPVRFSRPEVWSLWKINFQFRGGTRGKTSTPKSAGKSWSPVRAIWGNFFEEEKKEIITRRPGFSRLFLFAFCGGKLPWKVCFIGQHSWKSNFFVFFLLGKVSPGLGFVECPEKFQPLKQGVYGM